MSELITTTVSGNALTRKISFAEVSAFGSEKDARRVAEMATDTAAAWAEAFLPGITFDPAKPAEYGMTITIEYTAPAVAVDPEAPTPKLGAKGPRG